MNNKSIKPIVLLFLLFLVCAISFGFHSFYYSKNPGSLFTSIFLGVLFAWAIVAPIIRISYGEVPFLKIYAVLPVLFLPFMWVVKALPSKSLLFIPVILVYCILSLSYLGWLHGLEFFVLFKRSTWSRLFNKSNQDDPNEK